MLAEDIGDGCLPAQCAVVEVPHVVVDRVDLPHAVGTLGVVVKIEAIVGFGQRSGGEFLNWSPGDGPAIHKQASLLSLEQHSLAGVFAPGGVEHFQLDSVGVSEAGVVAGGDVVAVGGLGVARRALDGDRSRVLQPGTPLGDVEVMGAGIGHFASRVFVPPAKGVMAALREIGDVGGLSLPEVPLEMARDGLRIEGATLRVLAQHDGDLAERSEAAGLDQFRRLSKPRVAALPRSHLDHAAGFTHDATDDLALGEREGEGLFAVDIFARPAGVDEHAGVPVVGGANQHDVDMGEGEQIVVILKDLRGAAKAGASLLTNVPVDIAERDHIAIGECFAGDDRALVAEANAANAPAGVGRAGRGGVFGPGGVTAPRRAGQPPSRRGQERTTGNSERHDTAQTARGANVTRPHPGTIPCPPGTVIPHCHPALSSQAADLLSGSPRDRRGDEMTSKTSHCASQILARLAARSTGTRRASGTAERQPR